MFEATPGYLETIGAHVIEGRLPAADAFAASRSVIINESAARKFPEGGAIGRELRRAIAPEGPFVVAAVIRDLRHGGPLDRRGLGRPQMFFPLEPSDDDLNAPMMAVVRPAGARRRLGAELRDIAQSIGPPVLVERLRLRARILRRSRRDAAPADGVARFAGRPRPGARARRGVRHDRLCGHEAHAGDRREDGVRREPRASGSHDVA